MNAYLFPISIAAWTFPLLAAALTLPYVVYSYRKFGAVSLWRTLILFSMLFYLQCAYYLVVLPLPDPATVASRTGPFYDAVPFHFIYGLFAESGFEIAQPRTWLAVAKTSYVYEPAFNFLLTVPFGFYVAYYFKKSLKKVFLFAFLLSLSFELLQLTGLLWIYPKPYRLFSVDDLILNTLGGAFGYFIYTKFLRFLPARDEIDKKSAEKRVNVGFTRRAAAFFIDALVIAGVQRVLIALSGMEDVWAYVLTLLAYGAAAAILRGVTVGKALVRVRIAASDGERARVVAVLLRYLLRNALLSGFALANWFIKSGVYGQLVPLLLLLLLAAASAVDLLLSLRRGKRLWYERVSKTKNVSLFKQK
jgi:glycopeptide antibiotics resistance protein